ncbi:UNVERIFIED_CONTAM: hypothetical protein Scaly_3121300 [Sesamum calycinum]|uniref:DUF4218 domain-containing protein n=1 Tax=Sesamum calycinum TaxID=2727403 RepID=A0AAW2JLG5_9LAMI
MPKTVYILDLEQKRRICEWITHLKFSDGYTSNLARCVNMKEGQPSIPDSMFDDSRCEQARVGGPIQYRWMYPFERFLRGLKIKVKDKSHVEASIVEAYLVEEISLFTSHYFEPQVLRKRNMPSRNDDLVMNDTRIQQSIFNYLGQASGATRKRWLSGSEQHIIKTYILTNREIVTPYYDVGKSTFNCGVSVKSSSYTDTNSDFYEILEEVHPRYHLVDVNCKKYTERKEPFILTQQVVQVYYTKYPSMKRDKVDWLVVYKIKARRVIDDSRWTEIAFQEDETIPTSQVSYGNHNYELHDQMWYASKTTWSWPWLRPVTSSSTIRCFPDWGSSLSTIPTTTTTPPSVAPQTLNDAEPSGASPAPKEAGQQSTLPVATLAPPPPVPPPSACQSGRRFNELINVITYWWDCDDESIWVFHMFTEKYIRKTFSVTQSSLVRLLWLANEIWLKGVLGQQGFPSGVLEDQGELGGKSNRVIHCVPQRILLYRYAQEEVELGVLPTQMEVFERCYKKKEDGGWSSPRVTEEKFQKLLEEHQPQPTIDEGHTVAESKGKVKGRVFGLSSETHFSSRAYTSLLLPPPTLPPPPLNLAVEDRIGRLKEMMANMIIMMREIRASSSIA